MRELKSILMKPQVKGVILAILTLLFSVFSGFLVNNLSVAIWWVVCGVVFFLYIFALVKYLRLETDINSEYHKVKTKNEQLLRDIKTYDDAFRGINAICRLAAKQTNMKIHEIVEQGKIYCDNWNFEIASGLLCEQLYNHVINRICEDCEYAGNVNVEIAYVRLVESRKGRKANKSEQIKLCGFYHPSGINPTLYRVERSINKRGSDGKLYHDGKLFIEKKNSVSILLTKEQIQKEFSSVSENTDYSQYVGIPVFCDTVSGDNKMVGLLEIVCRNNTIISSDESRVKQFVDLYLSTYASLFLLLFKNDKALRAMPQPKTKCTEREKTE